MLLGSSDAELRRSIFSVYSLKELDPLIGRDVHTNSAKINLFSELAVFHYGDDQWQQYYKLGSIDYWHLTSSHVSQANSLL